MTNLCWIDLETTGSRLTDSQILEIGVAITDEDGNIEAEESWLNPAPLDGLRVRQVDPVVIEMHAKSGLWADLRKIWTDPLNERTPLRPDLNDLNHEIGNWIGIHTGDTTQHIPLAGSGVSHFDRQFIRRDLPDVDRRLTYWAYDVGVVRRMLRLAGINSESDETQPNHRALDDVKAHIAEYRKQLELLRTIAPPAVSTGTVFTPLFPGRDGTELVEGGATTQTDVDALGQPTMNPHPGKDGVWR